MKNKHLAILLLLALAAGSEKLTREEAVHSYPSPSRLRRHRTYRLHRHRPSRPIRRLTATKA